MKDQNISRKGRYTLIASLTTSLLLVILFVALSVAVNSSRATPLYTQVDITAGMVFVFVLSMIVSASVWPAVIERSIRGR
jgi:hypothetical protein